MFIKYTWFKYKYIIFNGINLKNCLSCSSGNLKGLQLKVFLKCHIFTLFPSCITTADIVYSVETSYQLVPTVCRKALSRQYQNILQILTETVLASSWKCSHRKFLYLEWKYLWIEILNIQKRLLFPLKFQNISQIFRNFTKIQNPRWPTLFSKINYACQNDYTFMNKLQINVLKAKYLLKAVILKNIFIKIVKKTKWTVHWHMNSGLHTQNVWCVVKHD